MTVDSVVFYTKSVNKIISFYQDILGFELEYQHSDEYVSFIFPNKVRLGIKKSSERREIIGSQTIIIGIKNIGIIFECFKKKKCSFHQTLKSHEWGKDFALLDPDGNKIEFLERN